MPVAVAADNVLLKGTPGLDLVPGKRGLFVSQMGEQLARLAVVIEIDEKSEFDGRSAIDRMLFPRDTCFARILKPCDTAAEPRDADHLDTARPRLAEAQHGAT